MTATGQPGPQGLSDEGRERIRLVHHRLRKASQELEALLASRTMRGRWDPVPAPPEVVATVRSELHAAYVEMWRVHEELLGWERPAGLDA